MHRYYWAAGIFNLFMGCVLFVVLALWLMSFLYVADALGWIPDSSLEAGLLPAFLAIAFVASVIYLPTMIFANIGLSRRVAIRRSRYFGLAAGLHLMGLVSFPLLMRAV